MRVVSFGWRGADEQRMQQCFNWRLEDFGSFEDLQVVANDLGYIDVGVARLASRVLGAVVEKERQVSNL